MAIQEIIKDAQSRVEVVGQRAQAAANAANAANKKVVDITRKSATKLADVNSKAAKGAYEAVLASAKKAREAGVKDVAAKPVEFLPAEVKDLADQTGGAIRLALYRAQSVRRRWRKIWRA